MMFPVIFLTLVACITIYLVGFWAVESYILLTYVWQIKTEDGEFFRSKTKNFEVSFSENSLSFVLAYWPIVFPFFLIRSTFFAQNS